MSNETKSKEGNIRLIIFMVLFILALCFSSCTRYEATSTLILDDLGVKYKITKEIPHYPDADAVYVESEDTIYVKRGRAQIYLILHELVHKIRSDNKVTLGNSMESRKLEEAIAVLAAVKICKTAGISAGVGRYEIPGLISRTWKANGLDRKELSREQRAKADEEVKKTVDLFKKMLNDKGYDIEQFDWVRTAILILL